MLRPMVACTSKRILFIKGRKTSSSVAQLVISKTKQIVGLSYYGFLCFDLVVCNKEVP